MLKIEILESGTWFFNAHKVPVEIVKPKFE